MTENEAYKVHIQYTFNSFCKVVIRHAAIDIILKLRRRWEREVSLDYLMNVTLTKIPLPGMGGRAFPPYAAISGISPPKLYTILISCTFLTLPIRIRLISRFNTASSSSSIAA
jgi:hypothetical protein